MNVNSNATLQNLTVNGTIYINPGPAGVVTLNSVTATNIEILSGATSSIHLNNVSVATLTIRAANNAVRVVTEGTTAITNTIVESGAILATTGGSFGGIVLAPATPQTIELIGITTGVTISEPVVVISQTTITPTIDEGVQVTIKKEVSEIGVIVIGDGTETPLDPEIKVEVTEVSAESSVEGDKLIVTLSAIPGKRPTATYVIVTREINDENDESFNWNGASSTWDEETKELIITEIEAVEVSNIEQEVVYTVAYKETPENKVESNIIMVAPADEELQISATIDGELVEISEDNVIEVIYTLGDLMGEVEVEFNKELTITKVSLEKEGLATKTVDGTEAEIVNELSVYEVDFTKDATEKIFTVNSTKDITQERIDKYGDTIIVTLKDAQNNITEFTIKLIEEEKEYPYVTIDGKVVEVGANDTVTVLYELGTSMGEVVAEFEEELTVKKVTVKKEGKAGLSVEGTEEEIMSALEDYEVELSKDASGKIFTVNSTKAITQDRIDTYGDNIIVTLESAQEEITTFTIKLVEVK